MNLLINMLVEWPSPNDQSDSYIERILWICPSSTQVATIRVMSKGIIINCIKTKLRLYEEFVSALNAKEARVLDKDPYSALNRSEEDIKEGHRKDRDKVWALMSPLIDEGKDIELLIHPWKLGPAVKELARSGQICVTSIYKNLRKFWQAGRVKNAFLPAFDRCGAPGKRRLAEDEHAPKPGRKSACAKVTGQSTGIRVTAEIERRFERGIKKFYETTDENSLQRAYELTIETFFHRGFALVDGNPVPVLPPADELPSADQFRNWYRYHYRDPVREKKSRHGKRRYDLEGRELLGDSTQLAFGPGSLYQVDATIGDVYLVNSLDRTRIIGKPVIYFFCDVFSRALPGLCTTLEGPSWLGAMLALDNVAMDKVVFCAEYGITSYEHEWPIPHLPQAILADRGEFEGYDADRLTKSLGIRVQNAGPYRCDLKGIIERQFGKANEKFIHFLPGAVRKARSRGDSDYRLSAALTLNEFRQLLILYARDYNLNNYMEWYKKDEFMIADHVERYPMDIWEWGIKNRSGRLLHRTQEMIRLNLLPRKQVRVTERGIHFEKELFYICDMAIREGWVSRARIDDTWLVDVAYDPRSLDQIYLIINGGVGLEVCHLTAASKHLKGRDWHEATDYFSLEAQAKEKSLTRRQQSRATLRAQHNHIISEAIEKTQAARRAAGKLSKNAQISSIRENHAKEKQRERDQDAWRLGTGGAAENPPTKSQDTKAEEYIPASSKVALIRDIRNQEWNKNE